MTLGLRFSGSLCGGESVLTGKEPFVSWTFASEGTVGVLEGGVLDSAIEPLPETNIPVQTYGYSELV